MPLETSGTLSIGGTTTNRSINLELGRSATATSSLGETDLRDLAGVASGTISISNFYGASSGYEVENSLKVQANSGNEWLESQCRLECTIQSAQRISLYL